MIEKTFFFSSFTFAHSLLLMLLFSIWIFLPLANLSILLTLLRFEITDQKQKQKQKKMEKKKRRIRNSSCFFAYGIRPWMDIYGLVHCVHNWISTSLWYWFIIIFPLIYCRIFFFLLCVIREILRTRIQNTEYDFWINQMDWDSI